MFANESEQRQMPVIEWDQGRIRAEWQLAEKCGAIPLSLTCVCRIGKMTETNRGETDKWGRAHSPQILIVCSVQGRWIGYHLRRCQQRRSWNHAGWAGTCDVAAYWHCACDCQLIERSSSVKARVVWPRLSPSFRRLPFVPFDMSMRKHF